MYLKKTMMFLNLLIVYGLFFYPKVEAHSLQSISPYSIDHDKDAKKAKKWAENKYNAWKKTLNKREEKSLKKLLEPVQEKEEDNLRNINHQLKVYGGDLSARPIDAPIANKNLQEHVNRISQAINRKEGKLDKPLIVYKNETFKQTLHVNDLTFLNPDHTLDEAKVRQLKTDFSVGLHSSFPSMIYLKIPIRTK